MCNPLKCLVKRTLLCVICAFNTALSISGILCLIFGIVMLALGPKFDLIFPVYYSGTFAGSLLILVGFIMLALGFVGNIASCCGCNVLLYAYGIALTTFILFQLAASIGGVTKIHNYDNAIADSMFDGLASALKQYKSNPNIEYQINTLQTTFQCCGAERPNDFVDKFDMDTLPRSCCKNPLKDCVIANSTTPKKDWPYHIACDERFKEFLYSIKSFLGFVIFISIAELVFMVLVCGFICKFL